MVEKAPKSAKSAKPRRPPLKPGPDGIVRLAGGNPQIPKGEGDAVVQRFVEAMPGWQRDIGRAMDRIITGAVPEVCKSVKWNSPFYGTDRQHWFVSFHCMTKYIKVTFAAGEALEPIPAGTSKHPKVRYYDVYEGKFDPDLFTGWIEQASRLPGERF